MLLERFLRRVVQHGQLTVVDASGRVHRFGDPETGHSVTIRLHDRALHTKLWLNPRLYVGEAYMDGALTVEGGSIYDLLDLVGRNIGERPAGRWDALMLLRERVSRRIQQFNPTGMAQRNVAHHYDLSGELFDLFLDSDRQYSCAYFPTPQFTLDQAQEAKKRHIASKLMLAPGQTVLDIGSGWGGLGMYLADAAGVEVTGITLSQEQLKYARQRAGRSGFNGQVHFHLRDYREETGTYDRIVSVGMFEHVGTPHYREFFGKLRDLLADDGVALLHTIAHRHPPVGTNAWLRKYIFPGGYCPALSEILPIIERAGLWVTDVEVLRLHYAQTLRHWRHRFLANRDKAAAMYDERFCRMWEFYLAGCETAFRHMGQFVAQIQLSKSAEALPLTRDYMAEWEQAHMPARRRIRHLKSAS